MVDAVWSFHQNDTILYLCLHTDINVLCIFSYYACLFDSATYQRSAFKKTAVAWYSSVDPVFLLLICILYISLVGTDTGSMLGHAHLSLMIVLGLSTAFVPITYITFLMLHWIYSQRQWGLEILKNITIILCK